MARRNTSAPPTPMPSPGTQWLVLIAQLPTVDPVGRMKVLRTLETFGCAMLRDGVYLLPESPRNRDGLAKLAEAVTKLGGDVHMLALNPIDDTQAKQFRARFDRSGQYRELIANVESLKAGFGVSDPGAIARVLAKQRRELETISALDFFGTPLRVKAEATIAEMETQVRELMFPDAAAASPAGAAVTDYDRTYFRRVWATRKPLLTDRLASAWLIRRFIDAEATMLWLDKVQACPASAVSYAYDGAMFRNSKTRVTYQELLTSFELDHNPSLVRIGKLVHSLESGTGKTAEASGVETLLTGAKRRASNEHELLAESEKTFDLLYEAYFDMPAQAKRKR